MIQIVLSKEQKEILEKINPDFEFFINQLLIEYLLYHQEEIQKFIQLTDEEKMNIKIFKELKNHVSYLFNSKENENK